jgi:hypothetical protein
MTDKYFTIVFKDLTSEERVALWNSHPGKISASSHSHVMDDRDQLLDALSYAECALGDIGDADREPGDDLEWCERRAAEALPRIRKMLLAHGKTTTALTTMTDRPTPPPELIEGLCNIWVGDTGSTEKQRKEWLINKAYTAGAEQREGEIQKARDEELEACAEWLYMNGYSHVISARLRAARRLEPPSLKEQALADLDSMSIEPCLINGIDTNALVRAKYDNIRRALEALND